MKLPSLPRLATPPALISLMAIVGCTIPAAGLHGQSDNFNDGNDTGWSRSDPVAEALGQPVGGLGSTWTVSNGAYTLDAVTSPDSAAGPGRLGSLRQGVVYSNFCVAVDMLPGWDAKPDQVVRDSGARPARSRTRNDQRLRLHLPTNGPDVQISLLTGEVPTEVAAPIDVTLDPLKTYRMVFMGDGEYLEGRIYESPDLVNPVVIASGFSSDHAQNTAGLVIYDNGGGQGAVATFNNYDASALVPPELKITALSPSEIQIEWPAGPLCYKLQRSQTFAAGSWQDVPLADITYGAVTFHVQESVAGSKFFRLTKVTPP